MAAPVRWKLHIEGPEGSKRVVPVTRSLVLGRDAEVDLRLNDSSVSRRHAQLTLEPNGSLLVEDLGSANGVLVDDSRAAGKVKVRPGATLKLGLYTISCERLMDATLDQASRERPAPAEKGKVPATSAPEEAEEVLPNQPVLRFRSGPLAGKDVALIRREISLGRIAEGNDIVIPDESISRRHVELVRLGHGYSLKDLQSVNGTSVNGERVVSRPLRTGDRIKFGMVEADYLGPTAEDVKPVDRRLLKRVLVAATGVLLLLFLFEGFQLYRVRMARLRAAQAAQDDDSGSVEKSLVEAQTARRDERWDRAKAAYQSALSQDPVNAEARKGIKDVQAEIEMKQAFDRARQRVDVGQDEEGVEVYLQIAPTSIYYPRARAEVHRLAEMLKRRYEELCRETMKAGDQQGILQGCTRYLNLVCNSTVDEVRLKAVRTAEQKLGAKNRSPPWSCPPTYARWFADDTVQASNSLEQRIAAKYKNPQIALIVRIYANGEPRQALNRISTLKLTPAEAHDVELDKLQRQMELASGAYNDGISALQTGDWRAAKRQWEQFWEYDKEMLPEGDASKLAYDARARLGKQFYKLGLRYFQRQQLEEAASMWQAGLAANPGDADIQNGIIGLEHAADPFVADDASCAQLAVALKITKSEPPSLNHKRALAMFKDHECRP